MMQVNKKNYKKSELEKVWISKSPGLQNKQLNPEISWDEFVDQKHYYDYTNSWPVCEKNFSKDTQKITHNMIIKNCNGYL